MTEGTSTTAGAGASGDGLTGRILLNFIIAVCAALVGAIYWLRHLRYLVPLWLDGFLGGGGLAILTGWALSFVKWVRSKAPK